MKLRSNLMLLAISTLFGSFVVCEEKSVSFSLFNHSKEPVYKNSFDEKMCRDMANEKESKCVTQPDVMEKICKKACMDKIPYFSTVSVDEDEVFELEATSWNGKKIVFDQFDGFVTAVINLPLVCDGSETEVIQDFHKLTRILPSSLQYLIFPFVSEENGCDNMAFAKQIINGHKNIHVTKPTKVNGEETAALFYYLKDAVGRKEIDERKGTVFFVSPAGNRIDMLEDKTVAKFKRYTNENLKSWEL